MNPNAVLAMFLLTLSFLFFLLSTIRRAKTRFPPSPAKLPLIGNLHQLGPLPHRSLWELSSKHGPLMLLQMGHFPALIISSPSMAQQILQTQEKIFTNRPPAKVSRFLLYGTKNPAFAPIGEYWRQVRRICATHIFSSRAVQSFRTVREEEVALLLKKITRAASTSENHAVPLTEILDEFVRDLVCRLALGSSMMSDERRKVLCELIHANSLLIGGFYFEDYFPGLQWLDAILGFEGRLKKQFNRWDALLQEMLEEDVHLKEASLLQALLSLHQHNTADPTLQKQDIKAILLNTILAGSDSTRVVLDWIMAELIRNPEIMKKVQNEAREKCGANAGQLIDEDELETMVYLKAIVKETLRLHLPGPLLLPRVSSEECEIQGYIIPKQTKVIVNAWAIGRDPTAWEAAEEFKPERWLDLDIGFNGQDFHFLPFGSGRRLCPGTQLAIATIEIALANLLYCFEWRLPDGMEEHDINMDEAPGLTAPRKQKLELVATPYHN